MAETPEEEIDDLVSSVPDEDDAGDSKDTGSGSDGQEEAEQSTSTKRRVRRTGRRKKAKESEPKTIEEADIEELMPKGLPKPDSTGLRSLGDLYAKFGVGTYPEMKVHLYRTYPKIAPGGVKFDGFYDEYDMPILEQQIQAEYGGGQYRVVVVGPNPANPRLPKNYGSHSISLAGEPDYNRMPRALRKPPKDEGSNGATNVNPPPMVTQSENPKIAEAALRMFEKQAEAERSERRRLEERMEQERLSARSHSDPVAEAERRRADDLIKSERERSQATERFYQQQVEESRRAMEELKRDMERVERTRPSLGSELRELTEAGLFGNNRGSEAITEMFNRVIEKHRDEITALNKSHSEFVSHLRQGHATELQALREAHAREISAEREASRSREERIEDRLKSEREERRRDEERHRKDVELRDQHWKDRMEQALQAAQSNWESRHQSLTSTYENRVQWLQQEIDKLKTENYELRNKQEEKGDVMTQLLKYRELGSLVKEIGGADAASSSSSSASGGLGLSGGGQDDWKGMAVEAVMERAPLIMEKLFGGGSPQANQQAAQQVASQYHEGQVLDTPQGKMEVVRDPNTGVLALAPKELLDRHKKQVEAAQAADRGLLPQGGSQGGGGGRQRSARKKSRSAGVSAVPNLAAGLPRRRPPWEGGGDDEGHAHVPPPPPPAPAQPRMTTRTAPQPSPSEPIELSQTERMALREIAKAVHRSVTQGDDPEEFVQHMMEQYPAEVLKQVVGGYTDSQIVRGVVQLEPKSAGATPAGQHFMIAAFQLMRRTLS